jgi:glycosyltransferase involved in cell wall biosynthesis
MAAGGCSIVIDARVNAMPGAYGLARSVMGLAAHMPEPADGLALRVLVSAGRDQLFPLSVLPAYADVISTDITAGALHRCLDLAGLIRSAGAAALYVPYATFTPLIRPCPFVVTVHDCTIERDVRYAGDWLRQAGMSLATRIALGRAAAATAPTQAILTEIGQHYQVVPHPTVVPNGVDAGQFGTVTDAEVAAARARYQLPEHFILTVGAHRPHKNHAVLIRALAQLPASVALVIVGSSDPRFPDVLPRQIDQLGVQARVKLVPDVAEDWLPAVYQAASAFAFPSVSEGYGIPVLEAMAAGTPVVISAIPALTEVAGGAALAVPPGDVTSWASALAAVLSDAALASRLAAAGRAVAASASWEHGAATLADLLASVAAGRSVRSSIW